MWREGYVAGGDSRFYVRAAGTGDDVIVLLHGWPQDGRAFRRVAPALVEAGHRVVCPDLKGFGRSDHPRRGYDPETLADEISQLIRNVHADRAVLVGHDWGGAVALATAFRHPGRVRALVLASAPYRQLDLTTSWHIPLMNVPVLPELAFRVASGPIVRGALAWGAGAREPFLDGIADDYAAAVARQPHAWLRYYRSLSRRAVVDWTIRRVRRRVPGLSAPGRPPSLRVPAMVLWGAKDRAVPYHLAPRVAWDLRAELVTLDDVGHFVAEEDPLGVADAIVGFLARVEGQRARRALAGTANP